MPRAALLSIDARVEDVTFGGHAIAIVMVGFDDKHKRIKFVSSWGSSWGDHGFGYLSYDYVEKHLSNAWTFTAATA